jgi:acetyl esterase
VPLDGQIRELLTRIADDPSFKRPTATDLAGARAAHEQDALRFTPPNQRSAVDSQRDVSFPGPAGLLTARVYRPQQSHGASLPTIVWFHGGGWSTGSLDTGDTISRALCSGNPAVVASIAYRLAPESPWPAAASDAFAALRWAADHVRDLGGDASRLCVGGDSAGGNLAAVVSQASAESGPEVAAQILLYPFLDLDLVDDARYPSLKENGSGYYVTRDDLQWCVSNYLAGADPHDPSVSPLRASDFKRLPPTILAVAEFDPLRDQGLAYAESLRAASVAVDVHPGDGLIHGYSDMLGASTAASTELERVLAGLRAMLEPGGEAKTIRDAPRLSEPRPD